MVSVNHKTKTVTMQGKINKEMLKIVRFYENLNYNTKVVVK